MNPDSRQVLHLGVNFVIAPLPIVDQRQALAFQQSLVTNGIDITRAEYGEGQIAVIREVTSLQIKIGAVGSPGLGQLLIVAPHPMRDIDLFIKEADAVVEAFQVTWPEPNRQLISNDASIRVLYATDREHAFEELWEVLLGRSAEELDVLRRPVLGGGLRLVMPPLPDDEEPYQIEIKIESYLQDTNKIYVEAQFTWPRPRLHGAPLDTKVRLNQVNDYIDSEVVKFIRGGKS